MVEQMVTNTCRLALNLGEKLQNRDKYFFDVVEEAYKTCIDNKDSNLIDNCYWLALFYYIILINMVGR